jgi:two-component system nitrate/nitrite response regulator NarL
VLPESLATTRPVTDVKNQSRQAVLRVVLVSHHALVAEAVRMALTGQGIYATVLPNGNRPRELSEIARVVDTLRPSAGLILCDIDDPVQLNRTVVLARAVPIRWLLLTSSMDETRWGAAIDAGARSVLPMSEGLDEVARVLRRVAAGRSGMSEGIRERSLQAWRRAGDEHRALVARMGRLTPREMTVLGLLAQGLTVKEIALRSEVAEGTVRSQVKAVLKKLGVSSQLAAVAVHRRVVTTGRRRESTG